MEKIKILHVDDQQATLDFFESQIAGIGDLQYLGGYTDPHQALDHIITDRPDIVFLDIEMPEKSGFWVADQVKMLNCSVVFVTSFTDMAVRAFEHFAIDYITKPFNKSDILLSVNKWRALTSKMEMMFSERLQGFLDLQRNVSSPNTGKIFINQTDKILMIKLDDIIHISAKENYSEFFLDKEKIISSKNLKAYEDILQPYPDFIRIQKSHIINKKQVRHIVKNGDRSISVLMTNNNVLPVSLLKKEDILKKLMS